MEQIKVGVVGVGRMGKNHCRVLSTMRSARLVGILDLDEERAERVASEYEVKAMRNFDEMLEAADAVIIASSTNSHSPLAAQALESGVDVLVEKPLAASAMEAQQTVELAEKSDRIVQVGHIERFNPAYIELKNLLVPFHALAIDCRRLSAFSGSNMDVDVVFDLLIHDIDLALDLAGREPDDVSAVGIQAMSGAIDHVVSHFHFRGGPLVTLVASRVTEEKIRRIDVTALQAYIESDLLDKKVSIKRRTTGEYLNHNLQGVKYRQESVLESIHVPLSEPLLLELNHFVKCVSTHQQPLVSARDGLKAIRYGEMIREKAKTDLVEVSSLDSMLLSGAELAQ